MSSERPERENVSPSGVRHSEELGVLYERTLPDGRVLQLVPEVFTYKLGVSVAGSQVYDDVWDYESYRVALQALDTWDGQGEPQGWVRYLDRVLGTYRRRPHGDPAQEYTRD